MEVENVHIRERVCPADWLANRTTGYDIVSVGNEVAGCEHNTTNFWKATNARSFHLPQTHTHRLTAVNEFLSELVSVFTLT
jgi:hypothetical protein